MKSLLLKSGIAESNILLDNKSDDTLSSIVECSRIIRQCKDVGSVMVCSDRYHQTRCRWLFYLLGISTRKATVPSGRTANGNIRWIYYYAREILAIPFDTLILLLKRE